MLVLTYVYKITFFKIYPWRFYFSLKNKAVLQVEN